MGVFSSSYDALSYLRDNNHITEDEFNRNSNMHFGRNNLFYINKEEYAFDLLGFDMELDL